MNINDLEAKARWVRQRLWEMTIKLQRGHVGSYFSCVDILVALYYGGVVRYTRGAPDDPFRDRIIISKGHAAATLYPILADIDYFPLEQLEHFGEKNYLLGLFADTKVPGIEAVSDSLGHGLGIGAGMALAGKRNGQDHRIFVLLGDAECNEGSVWEAAAFAGHYGLSNLIAIVDDNNLGILGPPIGLRGIDERWRSCGWRQIRTGGHKFLDLQHAFNLIEAIQDRPFVIIANTTKGKGVSFMEGKAEWHSKIPNEEEAQLGRIELQTEE